MRESALEEMLVRRVKYVLRGEAYKFTSPGRANVPDRLVLLPGGRVFFVELKSQKGRLSIGQKRHLDNLRSLGFEVRVLRDLVDLENFVEEARKCY